MVDAWVEAFETGSHLESYILVRPKECCGDDDTVKIDSCIGQDPCSKIADLQPEVASDGVSGAETEEDVLPPVVFAISVHSRFLANAVGETAADPHAGAKVIDDVPLDRVQGILFELFAAKEVVVVGEDPGRAGELEAPSGRGLWTTPSWGRIVKRLLPRLMSLSSKYSPSGTCSASAGTHDRFALLPSLGSSRIPRPSRGGAP